MPKKYNWFIAGYYFLLLIVLISWKSPNVAPPTPLRLAFILAMVFPAIIKYQDWMTPVVICFTAISRYSFSFSYLPYEIGIIAFVMILCAVIIRRKKVVIPSYLMFLALYTFFMDLITGGSVLPITYSLVIIISFFFFVDFQTYFAYKHISLAFCIASVVLSILFLTTRDQFAVTYGEWSAGLERSGWTDPNYFGMAIGMGCVAASIMLFSAKNNLLMKCSYVGVIGLTLVVSVLNASRGAILSIAISMVILLFFSKTKVVYKVLVIILAAMFLVFLFNNGYFALLEYRIQNDSGGGGGRLDIWALKLSAYFEDGNFLNKLFGYGGYYGANRLAVNTSMTTTGSHNDFVAFFVNYGPIGFMLLLYILFAPVHEFLKRQRNNIPLLAVSVYIALCCFTLEPLSFGHLPYFAFIFYAIVISRYYESES